MLARTRLAIALLFTISLFSCASAYPISLHCGHHRYCSLQPWPRTNHTTTHASPMSWLLHPFTYPRRVHLSHHVPSSPSTLAPRWGRQPQPTFKSGYQGTIIHSIAGSLKAMIQTGFMDLIHGKMHDIDDGKLDGIEHDEWGKEMTEPSTRPKKLSEEEQGKLPVLPLGYKDLNEIDQYKMTHAPLDYENVKMRPHSVHAMKDLVKPVHEASSKPEYWYIS